MKDHATVRTKQVLLVDAVASGTMGLALLIISGPLSALFGLPAIILRCAGGALLPFATWLVVVSRRPAPTVDAVRLVVACNVVWVVASVLVLLGGFLSPSTLGTGFILAQAVAVAAFAWLEGASIRMGRTTSDDGGTALAVAHLRNVAMGPEIREYLRQIDSTLQPFGGRFLVHGSAPVPLEGRWAGDLVIIRFPDRERALGWYQSGAYQAILPLRTGNSEGEVILVDTVTSSHRATDILGDSAATGRSGSPGASSGVATEPRRAVAP